MTFKTAAASLALALSLTTGASQASELGVPARAANMMGQFIAQQGNVALNQIRTELRDELLAALRPLLPDRAAENAAGMPPKPAVESSNNR